jgi:hypothetical protein
MAGPCAPDEKIIARAAAAIDALGVFGLIIILPRIMKPIVGTSIT